jgi:elongation factor Ts
VALAVNWHTHTPPAAAAVCLSPVSRLSAPVHLPAWQRWLVDVHASPARQEDLEREKSVLREEAKSSGKPAEVIEKMVTGRLRKYYKDTVLLEQDCMIGDGGGSVAELLKAAAASAGVKSVTVSGFLRVKCGEVEVAGPKTQEE